jgi:alpha-methylacyl-CoA racemase
VPAPRFSRTPASRPTAPRELGEGTRATLADWGIPAERIAALFASGVVLEPEQQKISAE